MRDIVFKNLISGQKRRRIISTSEITTNKDVKSIIRRHFVYIVREASDKRIAKPMPYLYIRKERQETKHIEKFFCRIKGSMYALKDKKPLLILFMHSLKITFITTPPKLVSYPN